MNDTPTQSIRASDRFDPAFPCADLGTPPSFPVNAAVVLLLHPGLGGAIEQLEGEHRLAFEHGHEAALDLSPEDFLLTALLGCLRELSVSSVRYDCA
jgi:hypothetical protein